MINFNKARIDFRTVRAFSCLAQSVFYAAEAYIELEIVKKYRKN